jgi:uncharacterized protein (DUF2249 family)
MKVTKDTKISELIKHDKRSIDAIASIAKPFKKLKNPILRKLMASRVNIAEAAKIGGASVTDFINVLTPLGFEFDNDNFVNAQESTSIPDWFTTLDKNIIIYFDVREILAQGNDPLKEIMKRFKDLEVGKVLCIINTFVPTPLVKLFEKDNTLHYVETISPAEYHTYFLKQQKNNLKKETLSKEKSQIFQEDEDTFLSHKSKYADDAIKEIDVRHLEMPGPMQTILAELAVLPVNHALYVNHKRIPMYLLEEIENENYTIHIYTISESEVKLLIEKNI